VVFGFSIGFTFESMARCWLCNKRYGIVNIFAAAVCWGLWKLRNCECFQGECWLGMKSLRHVVLPMMRCWRILVLVKMIDGFDDAFSLLDIQVWRPEQIGFS
jgi:hypothetical protein